MQPFPAFAHDEIQRLAQHEIGHWITARALNFVPGNVTAKLAATPGCTAIHSEGRFNIIVVEDLNSISDVIAHLERRIQVLWAGPVAEALHPYSGRVDREAAARLARTPHAKLDVRIAAECQHLLRNLTWASLKGDIATQLTGLDDRLWNATIQLVEANSPIILEVADDFAYRIEIAGSDHEASFDAAEIEALPLVQEWFGKLSPAHAELQALAGSTRRL